MVWLKVLINVCSLGLYSVITAHLVKKAKETNAQKEKNEKKEE